MTKNNYDDLDDDQCKSFTKIYKKYSFTILIIISKNLGTKSTDVLCDPSSNILNSNSIGDDWSN